MKKLLLLTLSIVVACATAMAADVDLAKAQNVAKSFMSKQVANGRLNAAATSNLKMVKAEPSVFNPNAVDYYIFNADKSYVVVAGDDLAPEILMYGEEGTIDVNDIPPAMQWLLNKYKYQIDGLKAGTHFPSFYSPKAVTAVPPMVTANWDQSAPYNNQCPTSGNRRALTGCPATSLAMCYYKWKWPKTFPAVAAISSSSSGGYSAPALGERQADWDNIIDEYTGPSNYSSTSAQKDAVAWLMRYAGQCIPDYMYGYDASGADDPEIYQGVLNMGYTNAQYLLLTELVSSGWSYTNGPQKYTDAQWNEWMLDELHNGRPIEYLAYDITSGQVSGHAFNVFGCDTSGKYYVNWGWSGDSNGYCALHNFTTSTGATGQSGTFVFKYGEAMIIGIEPPASAFAPTINIEVSSITLTPGQTQVIPISGTNITSDVIVSLNDPQNAFSLSVDGISQTLNVSPKSSGSITIPAASINDKTVNVRLTAKSGIEGEFNGSLSFASQGAETKTVSIKATSDDGGTASDAYLDIAKYATIDAAGWRTQLVNKIYKYTEYPDQQVGWLTMPVYGAFVGARCATNSNTVGSGHPQTWIECSLNNQNTYGGTTWTYTPTYTNPYNGSSAYFTGTSGNGSARAIGYNSQSNTTIRNVSFYVTNCTAVKLLGMGRSGVNNTYPARIRVYECTVTNGTPTASTTVYKSAQSTSTSTTTAYDISVTDLDETKVYKVEVSNYRGYMYEVCFQTPLNKPTLTVDPEELYISAEPNSSATATFNVKGKLLENPVTVTLADANGVFSVSPTSISIADAEASAGTDVTVTFSSQNTGNFTGTVTLTSGTLSKTVTLNGTCAEKGTAQGDYLDIAKYETVGEPAGWYSESYANPYKYTVYPNEGSAWLTVPASIAYIGYDEGNQGWVGLNQYGNPYWYGHQWSATDVFAGHEFFKSADLADADGDYAYMLGANVASTAVTTNTNMFYGMYFVTNCTQVKSYGYNNSGAGSSYPSFIMIYEMTEGADGSLTQAEDAFDVKTNSTANTQYILTSAELDPEKIYFVAVGGFRGFVYEVSFRTPMEGLPGVPEIVSAEPTATTSEVTWTPGENNDSWNLRYREYLDPEDAIVFFDDFENGLGNWTIYTDGTAPQADGWTITSNGELEGVNAVSGSNMASAWSWSSTAYNANNWLITPQVTFGKVLTFWVRTAGSWPDSYEVLLSTSGNAERNFTVTLQAMATAPTNNEWNQVTIDLSGYEGQMGYIAIHHESYDANFLLIDDFGIYNELAGDWIEVNNVTSPYTITGLTPETTYEVQVQGVNDIAASAWTPSTLFTTLGVEAKTLAWICQNGVITEGQNEYIIADKLIAVYADDVKGILWCKDMGNASIFSTSILDGQVDFLKDDPQAQNGRDWDQSNWIALHFSTPTATNNIDQLVNGAVNHYIKPGTIKGKLIDDVNYALRMDLDQLELVTQADDPDINPDYIPNVYCAANFLPDNLNIHGGIENGDGGYTGNPQINTQNYFFMNPKIQEICEITYAQWDALKGCFTVPTSSGFDGAFYIGTGYNVIQSQNFTSSLQDEHIYRFKAIVQRSNKDNYGPKNVTTPFADITIYPVDLDPVSSEIPTAINTVNVNGEVVGVEYVNSLGVVSKRPFSGMNIVVTRYSDGTTTSVKKIFK